MTRAGLSRLAAAAAFVVCGVVSAQAHPEREIGFEQINGGAPVRLEAMDHRAQLDFGIPLDEAVIAAELDLEMAVSPALLPRLSHLNLLLNGRFVTTVGVEDAVPGEQLIRTITVDPRLFADYNQLELELVGHYVERCQDPAHSSIWAQISPDSRLRLKTERLNLRSGLDAFPAPFFDERDNRELRLPMVFAAPPEPALVRAGAALAGWFGKQAAYRGARFPVHIGERLPDEHAVLLVPNDALPQAWGLEPVEAPTVSVVADEDEPRVKRLVIQGRDSAQLQTAVLGLIHGQVLLSGHRAVVTSVDPPPARALNDVPAWVPTDRVVKLGELTDSPRALQVEGYRPDGITLSARIPPDLFTGFQENVAMDLRYRYTRPAAQGRSRLAVFVNDRFVRSFSLLPEASSGDSSRIRLPLLDRERSQAREALLLPAFQLGIDNQLRFDFSHDFPRSNECAAPPAEDVFAAIDPDSSIDLTDFPRHAPMPDLALFANAGYPFTRYADLSQTLVVLPDDYTARDISVMFGLIGRLGRLGGLAGTRVDVARQSTVGAPDKDLLVIGSRAGWLGTAGSDGAPLLIDAAQRQLQRAADRETGVAATIRAGGDLGALVGFESPHAEGRSVVAVGGSTPAGLEAAFAALTDAGSVNRIRYGVTLVAGDQVRAVDTGTTYAVGALGWWQRIWFHFSGRPLLLALLAVVAGLVIAAMAYWMLRGVATARVPRD